MCFIKEENVQFKRKKKYLKKQFVLYSKYLLNMKAPKYYFGLRAE